MQFSSGGQIRGNNGIITHMDDQIQIFRQMLADSGRVVFFGGAGTSTESGIPDFRSSDGIFRAMQEFGQVPEVLLSHSFFMRDPETFFRYYRKYLLCPDAQPNDAHRSLARLEESGKLTAVITQNIDGLHQKAGSRHVLEVHGSVLRNHCMKCGKFYSLSDILPMENVPRCPVCGGIIKPDVVLYEEGLDSGILSESVRQIQKADMLIIGGTSLVVYPAAGLADYFTGKYLVVLNLSPTHQDENASLCIARPIGQVLREAVLEGDYGTV